MSLIFKYRIRMEHIIIENLGNDFKRLTAEDGYGLFNTINRQYYTEAIVKNIRPYIAVKV